MDLEEAREIVKDARALCQNYKEISYAINNISSTTKNLKRLFNRKNNGSKLIAIGLALIFGSPDPFSDILGIPLVAAGVLLNRMRGYNIANIYNEARKINTCLEKISKEIL